MNMRVKTLALVVAFGASGAASAALPADEIKQLGTTLTIWGAVKAGNADGSIPAYTGPVQPPANYDPKKPGFRPDPFAKEKPLYSITAANADKYPEKLSVGIKEMLKKYPTFRLDIYPTHRTANYPQYVLDNTLKNAATCKLAENRLQLAGTCFGGVPFPIPKNGSEVMWNRTMKYEQYAYYSANQTATMVDTSGRAITTGAFAYWQTYPHYNPARTTPLAPDEILEFGRVDWTGPVRKVGEKLVMHDYADMVNIGRRLWIYLPGQRRVKLSPDVAYDTPSPSGGGVGTVDDTQVFFGSQDRYDYKLVGKKELFIPYNTFKLHDEKQCSNEKVFTPHHLNPDCVRWELHRVNVVEATLKPGKRHAYPRRTIYWDEDSPGIGLAENYDDAGKIYRVTQVNSYPFYESTGYNSQEFVVHDLTNGAYVRQGYTPAGSVEMVVTNPADAKPASFYQSTALSAEGVR